MSTGLMQSAYRHTWWALVLRGLLGIVVGGVILWRPLESVAAFALAIALYALFNGVVQIVHAFDLRTVFDRWWVLLLGGLVSIAFGIAAIKYYPGLSLAFVVALTAGWLLAGGAVSIYAALQERKAGVSWGWTLASGIVAVLGGVFAFVSPPATLAALMGFIAAIAMLSGFVLLMAAYQLASFKRDVKQFVGTAAAH
jgi:uncharacterized membrane protein HdeD (DUF308 family)